MGNYSRLECDDGPLTINRGRNLGLYLEDIAFQSETPWPFEPSFLFFNENTVPPSTRCSHLISASIKPAGARMLAKPRPSPDWFCVSNEQPLSSSRKANSPS